MGERQWSVVVHGVVVHGVMVLGIVVHGVMVHGVVVHGHLITKRMFMKLQTRTGIRNWVNRASITFRVLNKS